MRELVNDLFERTKDGPGRNKDRACYNCFSFSNGCTHEAVVPKGSIVKIMPGREVGTFTKCPHFLNRYEGHNKTYLVRCWRDKGKNPFLPDAYGISLNKQMYDELLKNVGESINILVPGFSTEFIDLTAEGGPKRHFRTKVIGEWLLKRHLAPFPDDDPLVVRIMKKDSQTCLEIQNSACTWRGRPTNDLAMSRYVHNAVRLLSLGEPDGALYMLNKALKQDPRNYLAMAFMGKVFSELGRFNEALKYYNRALRGHRFCPEAWVGKAMIRETEDGAGAAERYLADGLRRHPEDAGWWFGSACWANETGAKEAGLKYIDEALRLAPGCVMAIELRSQLLRDLRIHSCGENEWPCLNIRGLVERSIYHHCRVYVDSLGLTTGIMLPSFASRNILFPRDIKSVRIWAKDSFDVEIPITEEFWTGLGVFEHSEIVQWLGENDLIDVPYYAMRYPVLREIQFNEFELTKAEYK